MRRWIWLFLGGFLSSLGNAAAMRGRLLAFAVDNRLTMAIGTYEPGHGWMQSVDFYAPPEPGDLFTLYGPSGKLSEVAVTEPRRAYQGGTFASWDATVSPWNSRVTPFALAAAGRDPFPDEPLQGLPLESAKYRGIVSRYLKSHGLNVDTPFLTQAFKFPIKGDGREVVLLVAHSDAHALADQQEANVYAVALLCWTDHEKESVLPLASQTSYKPAGRRVEDHEHLYGTRDFLRIISAVDIDGDGCKDIILYRSKDDATQIDVFTFDGRRTKNVLSVYKANYN